MVIGVIDGDTIVLEGKTRLRLRNLDAPELNYCLGIDSKEALENMVSGKRVIVKEQIIDQMGRAMALIYVGNRLINVEMLSLGLARFHSDNTTERERLKKAYDVAKANKIGIYSSTCLQTIPPNPKCIIKGNMDKNSNRKTYYLPGCAQYNFTFVEKDIGEDWYCTEKEAQLAGYSKSENCRK